MKISLLPREFGETTRLYFIDLVFRYEPERIKFFLGESHIILSYQVLVEDRVLLNELGLGLGTEVAHDGLGLFEMDVMYRVQISVKLDIVIGLDWSFLSQMVLGESFINRGESDCSPGRGVAFYLALHS